MPTAIQVVSQLQRSIALRIYGKEDAIQLALITLLGAATCLSKTSRRRQNHLAQALAKSFHCSFQRIQFTSDCSQRCSRCERLQSESRDFEFRSGPIFRQRGPRRRNQPHHPAHAIRPSRSHDEAQVTVDGKNAPAAQPFLVIATQNPVEHHAPIPCPNRSSTDF